MGFIKKLRVCARDQAKFSVILEVFQHVLHFKIQHIPISKDAFSHILNNFVEMSDAL